MQHLNKQREAKSGKKPSKWYAFLIHIFHPRYQTRIIADILKNKQKKRCIYSWDYMINQIENQNEEKVI